MTAYSEWLSTQANVEKPVTDQTFTINGKNATKMPAYMLSADTLSTANQNRTWFEAAQDAADSVPKFIAASMISGANQLYNIPADIGNAFGGEWDVSDTGEVIAALDSDLGTFYEEHKEGADLVGFIASSLIPGAAGIKVLNAGQKGLRASINARKFGTGTSKALGLLAPQKQKWLGEALETVASGKSVNVLQNKKALRAIGAGIGQNGLEALAFESAVAATMFNSPVLENQDFGDFVTNVAWGAGVFGILGGAVDVAKISNKLGKAADSAAMELRPWTFVPAVAEKTSPYERLILTAKSLDDMPQIPAGLDEGLTQRISQAAAKTQTTLLGNIRKDIAVLTEGDQEVAEALFQGLKASGFKKQQETFAGLVGAGKAKATVSNKRAGQMTIEAEKLAKKVSSGKASIAEIDSLLDMPTLQTNYIRTWGDASTIGTTFTKASKPTSLIDTLANGEKITVGGRFHKNKVTAGKKTYKFDSSFNSGKHAGVGSTKANGAWRASVTKDALESQARHIWVSTLNPLAPTATKPFTVHIEDIPMMEKVMLELGDKAEIAHVKFVSGKTNKDVTATIANNGIEESLGAIKVTTANELAVSGKLTQDEIAGIVNVKSSMLNGELATTATGTYARSDILALQSYAEEYTNVLKKQGSLKDIAPNVQIWNVPQHVKVTYDTGLFAGVDDSTIKAITTLKQQQATYVEATHRAVADSLGEADFNLLPEFTTDGVRQGAVPSGAGAGYLTAASSNYGTLAATAEYTGQVVSNMIQRKQAQLREVMEPLLHKLAQSSEASVEWSVLNNRIRNIEGNYAINEAGNALEPLALIKFREETKLVQAARAEGQTGLSLPKQPDLSHIHPDDLVIGVNNKATMDVLMAHIETNGARTGKLAGIRASQGAEFGRDPRAFYPMPVNPQDYKHFAMVIDESITSGNHSKTLYATSAEELQGMITKMESNPHLKVLTKQAAEDHYKNIGQWDYEKTLGSNYLDTEAKRKGVSANILPATDPQKIVNDTLNWHLQRETGLVRESVSAKYEVQFKELESLGKEATDVATSQFSDMNLLKHGADKVANPYQDYIKTALAIKKTADYPTHVGITQKIDAAFSKMYNTITRIRDTAKTPAELNEINRVMDKAGYRGVRYDADMDVFANASPDKGVLTAAVQKANAVMATVVLRWDTLNAVNNAVSANVLLGAETAAVKRAISRGDSDAIGALAKLAHIKVPGAEASIMAPQKLIANSIAKFSSKSADFKYYKDHGFMSAISDQYRNDLDELVFTGAGDSIKAWDSRIDGVLARAKSAGDIGERITGNKLAEEFNRFVAADVMKQMTDVAVTRNLMTAKEQLAYINTFVNRTQGNYLAAQRPMLFHGAIGQAVGLFQTYQFNLIQQLMRHSGEGHSKDAWTLLGLQGTIHGMNGLPGFNAINTTLLGNASGNQEHKDAFDATYGIAGKEAGDWLMYGLASNTLGLIDPALKVNLYTRGDINPRHVTLIPTDPSQVPIIQATGKAIANLFETAGKLGQGGDAVGTILNGLEHNGLSRPLAGLAQTLKAINNPEMASFSTSNRGNVIAANDLLSLTNVARMAGGKPLDEAIAVDAMYRFKAYSAKDTRRRQLLGESIKTTLTGGNLPDQDQIDNFAAKYASIGGTQQQFADWMAGLYKTANLSQTNQLQQNLDAPFSQSMQLLMGGEELRDFAE